MKIRYYDITESLAGIMGRRGLKYSRIEREMNMGNSTIARILAGRKAEIKTVNRIARYLGVSFRDLAGEPPKEEPRNTSPRGQCGEDFIRRMLTDDIELTMPDGRVVTNRATSQEYERSSEIKPSATIPMTWKQNGRNVQGRIVE